MDLLKRRSNKIVKLKFRSRSGESQVRVRKVRVRSQSCELKDLNRSGERFQGLILPENFEDLNINLKTLT